MTQSNRVRCVCSPRVDVPIQPDDSSFFNFFLFSWLWPPRAIDLYFFLCYINKTHTILCGSFTDNGALQQNKTESSLFKLINRVTLTPLFFRKINLSLLRDYRLAEYFFVTFLFVVSPCVLRVVSFVQIRIPFGGTRQSSRSRSDLCE